MSPFPFARLVRRFRRPVRRAALSCVFLAAAAGAHAEPSGAHWSCWPRPPEGISCWPTRAPAARRVDAAAGATPELLRAIRERPGALRGRAIAIPLNHAVPYDDRGVARLARLILCDANAVDCSVSFETDTSRWTHEACNAFADAHDPLLVRD